MNSMHSPGGPSDLAIAAAVALKARQKELNALFATRRGQLVGLPARDHDSIRRIFSELYAEAPNRRKRAVRSLENGLVLVFYSSDGSRMEPYFFPRGTEVSKAALEGKTVFVIDAPGRYRFTLRVSRARVPVVTIVRRVHHRPDPQRPCTEPKGYGPRVQGSVN